MITEFISFIKISDIFSLLTILIVVYVSQFYYHYFTRPNPLPGPLPLPIIGNQHQIGRKLNNWLVSMHKKYGDMFEVYLAGQRAIMLCRADLIEPLNVPSTKTIYPSRFIMTQGFVEYGVDGMGVANNNNFKSWKYNRQFFSQSMMTPSFTRQAIEWTSELWEEMDSCWNKLGENYELDLAIWIRRFTNEIIFKIATGVKNNNISTYYNFIVESNDPLKGKKVVDKSKKFVNEIETFIEGFVYAFTFGKFALHYVPFIRGEWKRILKNMDTLSDRIHNIIKERRIEIENTPIDQPLRQDMLTSFITANTPRDINSVKHADADMLRPMTDKEIFLNITEAMAGGTDTTANFFCFVVYFLGQYPEVKRRVQQELDEVLGKDLTKPITGKDLDQLSYCDAVTNEVFRHIPVAFFVSRINSEKDNVGGYVWPEGIQFQMLNSAIMMHKDHWTDPEKFDPDRFYNVEESDKYLLEKKKIKNSFPMFGGGIRICPGRKLAITELKCLIALVYRKYDVELADMNAPLNYKSEILNICTELKIKIKPRKF